MNNEKLNGIRTNPTDYDIVLKRYDNYDCMSLCCAGTFNGFEDPEHEYMHFRLNEKILAVDATTSDGANFITLLKERTNGSTVHGRDDSTVIKCSTGGGVHTLILNQEDFDKRSNMFGLNDIIVVACTDIDDATTKKNLRVITVVMDEDGIFRSTTKESVANYSSSISDSANAMKIFAAKMLGNKRINEMEAFKEF